MLQQPAVAWPGNDNQPFWFFAPALFFGGFRFGRIVTDSPLISGTTEMRKSTLFPFTLVKILPSWGRRFSMVLRPLRILIRLITAPCIFSGGGVISLVTLPIRNLILILLFSRSIRTSLAFWQTASNRIASNRCLGFLSSVLAGDSGAAPARDTTVSASKVPFSKPSAIFWKISSRLPFSSPILTIARMEVEK